MSPTPKSTPWIVSELLYAELGDQRLNQRLHQIAISLAQNPQASFPQAFASSAELKAGYRFFDNEFVEPEEIIHSHALASLKRAEEFSMVFAVQDTTSLDYTHHKAKKNVGHLANKHSSGFYVHTTMLLNEEGLPLGLLEQDVWTRDRKTFGKRDERKTTPIEKKESYKWIKSLEKTNEAADICPSTTFVVMGDRESDVYDLFLVERAPGVELLIRGCKDRRVEDGEGTLLWNAMRAREEKATFEVEVPKRKDQKARTAKVALRFGKTTLCPPKHRYKEKLDKVEVWGILAEEEDHPEDVKEPIKWLLLTTMEVKDAENALKKVQWYCRRWGIEVFHRVLKSGCKIEEVQLQDAENIKRCLPLYSVISWRIMYGMLLGRTFPDLECTIFLEDFEWEALYCTVHKVRTPRKKPPSVGEVIQWIGELGGFKKKKSTPHPGMEVMWRGLTRLHDQAAMYVLMKGGA